MILWKKKFPTPPLDVKDPAFNWVYSDDLHGEKLKTKLDLSHLEEDKAAALVALIKEYWCVFDDRGTFVTVRNYECIIDTGTGREHGWRSDERFLMLSSFKLLASAFVLDRDILDALLALAGVTAEVATGTALLRRADIPTATGNAADLARLARDSHPASQQ